MDVLSHNQEQLFAIREKYKSVKLLLFAYLANDSSEFKDTLSELQKFGFAAVYLVNHEIELGKFFPIVGTDVFMKRFDEIEAKIVHVSRHVFQ